MRQAFDPLDRADIQGNILRPYRLNFAAYLFVRVNDGDAARPWVGALADRVQSAEEWDDKPATTLNVALTYTGLAALGVPDDWLRSFEEPFREGMEARAESLCDIGPSEPGRWEPVYRGRQLHLLLIVHARDEAARKRRVTDLSEEIEGQPGVKRLGEPQLAAVLLDKDGREEREHFGFSDGMSQPDVEHSGMTPRLGQGTPVRGNKWKPLKVGEFILGYEDEDRYLPVAPIPPLGDNGTYMVFRKLAQDVAAWRNYVRARASDCGMDAERVAAKIVGRWPNGTPLELEPDRPDLVHENVRNDFRYGRDLDGWRCPLGAHIRRTNPRDALGWQGKRTRRHRLIRRGMPYGPPLPEGRLENDEHDRGLVFICFNASIDRQFETVQSWATDGNIFGLGAQPDFLTGPLDGTQVMTVQGRTPVLLPAPKGPFVTTCGGEYLFMPGIDALRAIGGGFPEGKA